MTCVGLKLYRLVNDFFLLQRLYGFLSGRYSKGSVFGGHEDYRSVMPQFQPEQIDKNQQLLELLERTAQEKHATPAQISLAWMLCKKPYIVPIPGTRKPERLTENLQAADVVLSPEEVAALDAALEQIPMSQVYGGAPIIRQDTAQ